MVTTTVLPALWALLTAVWVWAGPLSTTAPVPPPTGRQPRWHHVVTVATRPHPRLQPAGLVVGAAGLILAVTAHPILGLLPPTGAVAWARIHTRMSRHRATAEVVEQLPDVVDLLRLTTLAGLPVSTAIIAIGGQPGGPVGGAFHHAARQLRHGATTGRALAVLADTCGPPAQALVDALVDHDRYGTPLAPALDRVGIESRLRRRRQAEEAARRLPVTLLFPLVFTTLPASALLTVVPLLVASLTSLQP